MQDTYFAEKNVLGTGDEISYKAPPKNVFDYDVTTAGTFSAKNVGALDECAANSEWKVVGQANSGKNVTYTATPGCANLTPNFENIGKGS